MNISTPLKQGPIIKNLRTKTGNIQMAFDTTRKNDKMQ